MKAKIYYSLLLACLLSVMSCEDMLDKVPLDSPSSASFFNDKTEVDMGLFGCYERLVNRVGLKGNRPWIVMLDNTTDISWNRSAHYVQELGNGTANSQNLSCRNAWGDFYAVIARTNFLLDNIQNAEGTVAGDYINQVIGEARFLRAYCYFYLTELFGAVPLITEVISLEEAEM